MFLESRAFLRAQLKAIGSFDTHKAYADTQEKYNGQLDVPVPIKSAPLPGIDTYGLGRPGMARRSLSGPFQSVQESRAGCDSGR
jgi:hypothetical protein